MRKYSTILWDVDGTLLDFAYSQAYGMGKCFRSRGLTLTEEMLERYEQINKSFWEKLERGEITREQLFTARFEQLFEEYGITGVDAGEFWREYQKALGSVYRFKDDALTLCTALRGYVRQYVVTNGDADVQRNKIKLSGLLEIMDGVFISGEIGANKPEEAFFEAVFSQIAEQDKERILIVGDSLSSDILGGVRAGIRTCWYRSEDEVNSTDLQPDYEISDLHQVYDILQFFGK